MNFKIFSQAIYQHFTAMSTNPELHLFSLAVDSDLLWETYLSSYTPEENPIFKTKTEHDCSCCRHFIKNMGAVVGLDSKGNITSIWDAEIADPMYQRVANNLSTFVKQFPIKNIFLRKHIRVGIIENYSHHNGVTYNHNHFYVDISRRYLSNTPSERLGEIFTCFDLYKRTIKEITLDACAAVRELINQNSLYKGSEFKRLVDDFTGFLGMVKNIQKKDPNASIDNFIWYKVATTRNSAALHIKNTSIGKLLLDLSEGRDIDSAVNSYESIVAPTNYKRPTALVTKSMVDNAKKKLQELNLVDALDRRYANIDDISVENVIFIDRNNQNAVITDIFDDIATVNKKTFDKVEQIGIKDFIANVIPTANKLEVLLENNHAANLVSLITSNNKNSSKLFKWDNDFSWSYKGEVTDSIKERVKQAGGNVTGDLCCRLSWYNFDDLDLHLTEPNGNIIYYGFKRSASGGQLDVDMNAGRGTTRTPVENIFYARASTMQEGIYILKVHNYSQRERKDIGFTVEIDYKGKVYTFGHPASVRDGAYVEVAKFKYSAASGLEIINSLPMSQGSREIWGLNTNEFVPVSALMLSPNYWNEPFIGNCHYFFMLKQCNNPETARGFYNEFLREDLNEHRKVLELVGSKVRTDETANQLSGLGFSSTLRNSLLCRVTGNFTRVVKVLF